MAKRKLNNCAGTSKVKNKRPKRQCKSIKKTELNNERKKQTNEWSYRDKRALIDAIKQNSLRDVKQIADLVGNKSEVEVIEFANKLMTKIVKKELGDKNGKEIFFVPANFPRKAIHKDFPPLFLWTRVIKSLLKGKFQLFTVDHTTAILEMFKAMAEKEAEHMVPNSEMPDLKKCYEFIGDCLSGTVPAQVPFNVSTILSLVIKLTVNFSKHRNFAAEKSFAENYMGPTRFVKLLKGESLSEAVGDLGLLDYSNLVPIIVTNEDTNGNTQLKLNGENTDVPTKINGMSNLTEESFCSSVDMSRNSAESTFISTAGESNSVLEEFASNLEESELGLTELKTAMIKMEPADESDDDDHLTFTPEAYDSIIRHLKVKEFLNPLVVHIYSLFNEHKLLDNHFLHKK